MTTRYIPKILHSKNIVDRHTKRITATLIECSVRSLSTALRVTYLYSSGHQSAREKRVNVAAT